MLTNVHLMICLYLTERQIDRQIFDTVKVWVWVFLHDICYLPSCFAHTGIKLFAIQHNLFHVYSLWTSLTSPSLSQWDINSLGSFYTKTALSLVIIGCTNGRISKKLCFAFLNQVRECALSHSYINTDSLYKQNKNTQLKTVTDQ